MKEKEELKRVPIIQEEKNKEEKAKLKKIFYQNKKEGILEKEKEKIIKEKYKNQKDPNKIKDEEEYVWYKNDFLLISINILLICNFIFFIQYFWKKQTKDSLPTNSLTEKTNRTIKIYYEDFWPGFDYNESRIYHYLTEKYIVNVTSDHPDYLFFSHYGTNHLQYPNKEYIKIYYTPDNYIPFYDECDYGFGFSDMTFLDRFLRAPVYSLIDYKVEKIKQKFQKSRPYFKRPKFCAVDYRIIENDESRELQEKFIAELSKYKPVDKIDHLNDTNEYMTQLLNGYKFSIHFENYRTEDYASNKIFYGFAAGTVPIYFGDDNLDQVVNSNAYIHIKEESQIEKIVEFIKEVDNSEKLYKRLLRERIFIDEYYFEKQEKKQKEFLYHIFDQEKTEAKRIHPKNED